ncbi:hypothetical protein GGS23DRAFT_454137 [Durotheca rogersii]|uniref:uncharacterized protein n=1 Tax=Durotheca rogersii TaxID=419775 RepID=UPI002220DABC|nr:uncharacterized protein GGS23DRAFT_454137 [Durotheca rogersii]KAI5864588.1 hypothetical protein GGS23DRAFT_454137 [Durotheca rogersii]
MYSAIPVYSYDKEPSGQMAADEEVSPRTQVRRPSTAHSPKAPVPHVLHDFGDLLGPAIDGPPSPERIRALSVQMKRNSITDKHRSELTTSSGSSSRLSATSDRPPSWNQSLESLSLSRNPSQRSTSSNLPSRDRYDSVQFFSKGLFTRRGKLRRESTDRSASNTSLDVTEVPNDASSTAPRDHFIQSVFTRRRALRGESNAAPQKKLQISGPFNFEHLTHRHKDSVPDLDRTSRMELVSEFSLLRSRRTTEASINISNLHPDESQFTNVSSETFFAQEDPSAGLNAEAQSQQKALPMLPPSAPSHLVKRVQSQDKMRVPPQRPPRSPTERSTVSPVQPPPRTSSRVSVRNDSFHMLMASIDRPATSVGFRQPQPFAPVSPQTVRSPSVVGESPVVGSTVHKKAEETRRPSHSAAATDNAAWPLPNNVNALPDVPEEEEQHALTRQSRMSVTSNHSSLRGSVSVPLLRQVTMAHHKHQRPPSNASDTLGRLEFLTHSRALRADSRQDFTDEDYYPENWEDDIDYCYEHAAEADCDYAWERPSCDIGRESETEGSTTTIDPMDTISSYGLSPGLLSPIYYEVPVLSPSSQASNATHHEAVTPTNLAIPVTSNFSLPRRDSTAPLQRGHARAPSRASSFMESQGFSLSPSLLIPNDYHQQMLQYEREELQDSENDEYYLIQGATLNDEPMMPFGKSISASKARSSASTTDSFMSEHSATSSRHKSTASTSTAFTRWTGSSTSSWHPRDSLLKPADESNLQAGSGSATASSGKAVVAVSAFPGEESPASPKQDLSREKHARTQSHAGLLMRGAYDAAPAAEPEPKSAAVTAAAVKETVKTRRRARTTSRSHNSPQFALFPNVSATGPGNRI